MTSQEPNKPPRVIPATDWFLQALVKMINDTPIEFGITLHVGGLLISGSLVSGSAYFKGFAAEFSSMIQDQQSAESVREAFEGYGDIYGKEAQDQARPAPEFIHLRDARFFNTAGKPIPSNRGVWWRGRVSKVAGFNLGSLSASDD